MHNKYNNNTLRKINWRVQSVCRLCLSAMVFTALLGLSAGNLRAQQATCDYPVSYNTEQQPTYSGLTGFIADFFNSFFGARGSITNRQNGYDDEANLLDPQTYVEFQSPAASWSGGALDPITQIISSIRYSYRVGLNGSAPGDVYVVISSEGNLFNANILQTIELRVKNNGTVIHKQSFNQLAQWLIELGGIGSKKAYKIPVSGNFNELEIASVAGFGPNVQSLVGAAAPFMKLYDIRRIPKQPGIPTITTTNGTVSACANVSQQTTFSINNPQSNLVYNWYTAASGGSPVFTGTTYKPAATTSTGATTYYVDAVVKSECKEPIKRTSASRAAGTRTVTTCDLNADADGDGIKNGDEGYDPTNPRDTDGDGKPDYLDKDSDNDGIPDSVEKGSGTSPVDTDGDTIPDYRDLDSDNDGINDVREALGSDANNDGRADGTPDPNTGIPSSAGPNGISNPDDADGDGKPNYRDLDSDNDGKSDLVEFGNTASIAGDKDNDGAIDYASANDPDKDGIMSPADGQPTTWGDSSDPISKNTGPNTSDAPDYRNPKSDGTNNDINSTPYKNQDANGDGKIDNTADPDNDGIPNVIDTKPSGFGGLPTYDPNGDDDGDGIKNGDEGGPNTDTDGDGIPDAKDKDSDNDGIPDSVEKGSGTSPVDTDGDTIPDYRDLDSDNDGATDVREGGGTATDTNNDGRADGTPDPNTGIPSSAGPNGTTTPRDTDGDGKPNYRDLDSDNDGKSDLVEFGNGPSIAGDKDNDGVIDYSPANDPDKDGIMTPTDGAPNNWGDWSDPSPKNTGPNTSDAPDYTNPKSDGTNNDINSTPYKNQDANGDGKIDNTADPDNDGIPNVIDTKPSGFGGLPTYDPNGDDDGDGIKNGDEGGPNTDTDGDGIPDAKDKDSDNDGIPDSVEKGSGTSPVDTDGDTIPDYRDLDSDNDGINDVREGGGTATDTNNDGRADGTPDPNTGIPSSAGPNGTNTPRDTDGDGKPDYKDLDSDNDSIGDLQESGNPTAIAGDVDKDGMIDYSPANDPDKDGIMSPADGLPTTRGDGNDATPKNTGPNTSDAPDYINPKSDGTNTDISKTPNKGLDGNGDGKIDNTADPDGDGIANVIDKKPTEFGGIDPVAPPVADLTPVLLMNQPDFSTANTTRTFTLSIYNVSAVESSGAITVYVLKPTPKFTMTFEGNGWTSVDSGAYYTLTSSSKVPANFSGTLTVSGTITKGAGVAKGTYNLQAVIGDGSGSEQDNTNNTANVTLNVN